MVSTKESLQCLGTPLSKAILAQDDSFAKQHKVSVFESSSDSLCSYIVRLSSTMISGYTVYRFLLDIHFRLAGAHLAKGLYRFASVLLNALVMH